MHFCFKALFKLAVQARVHFYFNQMAYVETHFVLFSFSLCIRNIAIAMQYLQMQRLYRKNSNYIIIYYLLTNIQTNVVLNNLNTQTHHSFYILVFFFLSFVHQGNTVLFLYC